MIARHWRGWTTPANADAYAAYYQNDVLPHLRQIVGFCGAHLFRRPAGAEVEFLSVTRFASLAAVRAFAGGDAYETAVVTPHAQQLLTRFDSQCLHYEIAVDADGQAQSRGTS